MSDNITLHKSDCALLLGGYQCTCGFHQQNSKTLPALAAEQPKHPGYVIGSHWLETAYSRICAGEAEADVLRDIGLARITDGMVETADIHAIVDRQEALRRQNERLREALELALNSHGRMLMSDPPQDAWKFNRVDEVIVAALRREEA